MPLKFELCPGRMIGGNNPCFIIAEIGQNHQGDIEIAKKMIKMAKVSLFVLINIGTVHVLSTGLQVKKKSFEKCFDCFGDFNYCLQ